MEHGAGARPKTQGPNATHDDVLAQLALGTWRYLLPSNSIPAKQRLWDEAVASAFSGWGATPSATSIVRRVARAHELRNRVAHLEPLHRFDLRAARRDMRDISQAIGQQAGRLFVETERLLPIVDANPFRE